MGIKIETTSNINLENKSKVSKRENGTFLNILNSQKSEAEKAEKEELSKKYDNSSNIKVFGKILSIDMKKNKEKYIKENGKLNIVEILNKYGDKVNTKGLNELVTVLNSLFKEGLIDEKDYFEALKWIRTKIFEKSLQISNEKKEFEVIKSLDEE